MHLDAVPGWRLQCGWGLARLRPREASQVGRSQTMSVVAACSPQPYAKSSGQHDKRRCEYERYRSNAVKGELGASSRARSGAVTQHPVGIADLADRPIN